MACVAMTFILGCKTATTAFLAADAALSAPEELLPHKTPRNSVFGEYHQIHNVTDGRIKYEGYPKIRRLPNAAVAFAGPVAVWEEVATCIERSCIEEGRNPVDSLRYVTSSTPLDRISQVGVVLAYYDGNGPTIVSWNHEGSRRIEEHTALCMIGNVGDAEHDAFVGGVNTLFECLLTSKLLDGASLLACILGHLQRSSLDHDLMTRGIGGTYSGVWIDRSGVHPQPDILYAMLLPAHGFVRTVGTIARDDCLYASSGPSGHSIIFSYPRYGESAELMRQRVAQFEFETLPPLQWDFFSIVSGRPMPGLTIMELKRNQKFPATGRVILELKPIGDGAFDISFYVRTFVEDVMNDDPDLRGDIFLVYLPYDNEHDTLITVSSRQE